MFEPMMAREAALALNQQVHQGHYGEAVIRALSAAAGLQITKMEPDVSGEDFVIGYKGFWGGMKNPRIEAQVKSWSTPRGSEIEWHFRGLTERQYNELIGCRVPRFLFVVIVPPDPESYVQATHDVLSLHHAAYWASFESHRLIEEPSGSRPVTVSIPKQQLLTVTSLHCLIASTEKAA